MNQDKTMFNKSHFVFLPMSSLLSIAALILLIMSPAIAEDGHAHEAPQSDQQAQAQLAESNQQHDHEITHDKDNHDESMPKEDEHDHQNPKKKGMLTTLRMKVVSM
jgi:ABC-type nickel/cobalt efflux system permease component RcnA